MPYQRRKSLLAHVLMGMDFVPMDMDFVPNFICFSKTKSYIPDLKKEGGYHIQPCWFPILAAFAFFALIKYVPSRSYFCFHVSFSFYLFCFLLFIYFLVIPVIHEDCINFGRKTVSVFWLKLWRKWLNCIISRGG